MGGAENLHLIDRPVRLGPLIELKPCRFCGDIVNATNEGKAWWRSCLSAVTPTRPSLEAIEKPYLLGQEEDVLRREAFVSCLLRILLEKQLEEQQQQLERAMVVRTY
jgi:hypothetical protein